MGVNPGTVSEGAKVIIFSHDLDDYSLIPFSLRRDFQIKAMRSWYLKASDGDSRGHVDQKPDKDSVYAGIRFFDFMGRRVEGYYCSITALIASGDFSALVEADLRGTTIVQMVPDFYNYRTMCKMVGSLRDHEEVLKRSLSSDDQIAQHLSEESFLNLIGFMYALTSLRNNPFNSGVAYSAVQAATRELSVLQHLDSLWKLFQDLHITHSIIKIGDHTTGIGAPKLYLDDHRG